jgi:L-amino acid N-acyltransferase YncA
MNLKLVRAIDKDAPLVAEILSQAVDYKVLHGDMAWEQGPFTAEEVLHQLKNTDTYITYLSDEPVGTFAFKWTDEKIWGDQALDAGYVHRLAIKGNMHGKGLGAEIINLAASEVAEKGLQLLRLDCELKNKKLCAYYEKLGFEQVGIKKVKGFNNYVAALYQKPLSK